MAKKQSNWVSASDAGRDAYCPHYLELKYSGAQVSAKAQAARARGDAAHAQFNADITAPKRDSRCFIATQVYGLHDPRTDQLRLWRDEVLMPSRTGRLFVRLYYATSPALVLLCRRLSIVDRLARWCLDRLRRSLKLATEE